MNVPGDGAMRPATLLDVAQYLATLSNEDYALVFEAMPPKETVSSLQGAGCTPSL